MKKLILCFGLLICSQLLVAQERKLTLKLDKKPVGVLFQQIQGQCKYNLVYSNEVISDTILVSVDFVKVPVSKVLDSILPDKQLFYRLLSENMIVIGSLKLKRNEEAAARTMLSGEVTGKDGYPVPFATVSLFENGNQVNGTIAGEQGDFHFSHSFAGNQKHLLKVSSIGYEALLVDFSLAVNTIQNRFFGKLILSPSAKLLDEVKVSGNQKIIEMSGVNIIFNVSKSISAQGSNALELLGRAPGVTIASNNSISLNGKSGAAILIDGRLTNLSGAEVAELLKSMSAADIKSIEIINSPGAKYDASGTAGIINVRTRKFASEGFNAALSTGLNYGVYLKNTQDLSFSFGKSRLNIFGNYSHFFGNYSYRYGGDRIQEGKFYNSFTDDIDKRKKMGSRLGADFAIDKKQTIGVLLNGNFLFGGGITDTRTEIGSVGNATTDQVLTAINDYYHQQTQRYNVNLNYKYEDTLGRVVNVDADYGDFTKGSGNLQSNRYTNPDNSILSDNLYRSVNAIDIGLKAIKIDYSTNLFKGKIETGMRYSSVRTGNDSRFLEVISSGEFLDPSRSNHFVYHEAIKAAYLSYKKGFGKWQLEGGVRVENASSSGKLDYSTPVSGNQQVTDRNYTNLFPAASLSFKPSGSHNFSINYSKRIDRPAYQDLNPFIYLLDELSYWQGNPFLQPEISHRALLQYSYKGSTIIGFSYTRTNDFAVEVTDTVGEAGVVMVPRNLGVQQHWALTLTQTQNPFSWWNITFNGTLFHLNNDIDFGSGRLLDLKQTAARLNLQQNFKMPYQLNGEIAAVFNSKRLFGANQVMNANSQIDLALQRNFMKQRATLRLIFSDIYRGSKASSVQQVAGLYIKNYSYFEARQIKLNFSYRFNAGNSKGPRARTSALEAEIDRIK